MSGDRWNDETSRAERRQEMGWWIGVQQAKWEWVNEVRRRAGRLPRRDPELERQPPKHTIPDYVWDARPGDVRDHVRWAIDNRPDKFTPAQRQALELTYCRSLSQRKAADVAGCTRSAFRKRLAGADRALRAVLYAEWGISGKRPSEVRRGRNAGRAVVTEGARNTRKQSSTG